MNPLSKLTKSRISFTTLLAILSLCLLIELVHYTIDIPDAKWEINSDSIRDFADHGKAVISRLPLRFPLYTPTDNDGENASKLRLFEDGKELGPAHSAHQMIMSQGGGRFSHWKRNLIYSASDNTDPRNNNRHYIVTYPRTLSPGLITFSRTAATIAILLLVVRAITIRFGAERTGKILRNVGIPLALPFLTLLVAVLVLEISFRATTPFITPYWPSQFVPDIGFLFTPNSTVKWTNGLDFWAETKTNEWGFLDYPPPSGNKQVGACRVAIIGDSFVEAAQVANEQKMQTLIEKMAPTQLGIKIEAAGFGYSGTGQLNQIPFYEKFARKIHPDLVVLVVVNNDFSNNSAILEAIRNGWHPVKSPRLFARRNADGTIVRQAIDNEWLAAPPIPNKGKISGVLADYHPWLTKHSYFYHWLDKKLQLVAPKVASVIASPPISTTLNEQNRIRTIWLDKLGFSDAYEGWDHQANPDIDARFEKEDLPHVFQEALAFTEFGIQEFKRMTAEDDTKLALLITSTMGDKGRHRIKEIGRKLDIPVIDQKAHILDVGGDLSQAHWKHDGHWTPEGHRWAAEALLKEVKRHNICGS